MKHPIDSHQIDFLLRRLQREFPEARDAVLMEIILQADKESPADEEFHSYTERVVNKTWKRYAKTEVGSHHHRDFLLHAEPRDPHATLAAAAAA